MAQEKLLAQEIKNEINKEKEDQLKKRKETLMQYKKIREENDKEKELAAKRLEKQRLDDIEAMR